MSMRKRATGSSSASLLDCSSGSKCVLEPFAGSSAPAVATLTLESPAVMTSSAVKLSLSSAEHAQVQHRLLALAHGHRQRAAAVGHHQCPG